jgi:hypothetical protein
MACCSVSGAHKMLRRVEKNLFFEQAIYLVLFASNSGGV